MKTKLPIADCRLPIERQSNVWSVFQIVNRKSEIRNGFTLVELLVVITIIAVLAGFTFSVMNGVKRRQYISHAQAEMGQVMAAIDSYHETYGVYPPDNRADSPVANQLYYELEGTTNNAANNPPIFTTLDGATSIKVTDVPIAFTNVGGFFNCNKPGSSDETQKARNFIHELKPTQIGSATHRGVSITVLACSVHGPDSDYTPLGVSSVNPWRYISPGTNNPNSYDLWIQLSIGGKTNLICNWSKEVQINSPLP